MNKSTLKQILTIFYRSFALLPILFMSICVSSCNNDNEENPTTNIITLSSETFGNQPFYTYGYSFEQEKFLQRISSGSEIDIYLAEVLNPMGELIAVEFSTNTVSESTFGFYLNAEFNNETSASDYYTKYIDADFPEYSSLSDTIKVFQVYTFRTWKSNFVKFWIKDLKLFYSADKPDYYKVDIEYFIQRDGTEKLEN